MAEETIDSRTGRELPLVTIVVPVFNQSEFLEECLRSVVAQTRQGWEVVVVDDGSTRGDPGAVVRGIGDLRFRLVRHAFNRGPAAARNTGVREGRGVYILQLDGDDLLDPTYLAATLSALEASPGCNVAFTDLLAFGVRRGRLRYRIRDVKTLLKEQWIPGAGTLFHRSLWESVQGYCEADALRPGNEDWEFWVNVAQAGLQATHVPQPLYLYRQHIESTNHRLQYFEHATREFISRRHQDLFDRYGMKGVFLSGGYLAAAKARWRKGEYREGLRFAARSFLLAPAECIREVAALCGRRLWRSLRRVPTLRAAP